MSFLGKWDAVLFAAVLLASASGCSPTDSNPLDEEKEPHYVLGKSRVNAFNYTGAIDAFQESLEANPHSAPAHYQLAMLFENQESDPAAAIYHYQQYLKYDPKAENAEVIQQHIDTCKRQLASDVLQLPSAPAAQQQLEKLTEENRRLHDQLAQWQAYYAAQQAAAKTNPPAPQIVYVAQPAPAQPQVSLTPEDVTPAQPVTAPAVGTPVVAPQYRVAAPKTFRPHTQVVFSGDTMASIARKHGISLYALEAANPAVNPKKLRAGQVLNLPSP